MSAALREAFRKGASWGRCNANDLGYFKPRAEAAAKAHYPPKTETRPRVITLSNTEGTTGKYRLFDGRFQVGIGTYWTNSLLFTPVNGHVLVLMPGMMTTGQNLQALESLIRNPTETVEVAE